MNGEAAVVARAAQGDSSALGWLYVEYRQSAFAAAYSLLRDVADASDVVQDVFAHLPGTLREYKHSGSLDAWLRTVATRAALSKLRRRRRRRGLEKPDWARRGALGDGRGESTAINLIALERALGLLDEKYQTVVLLKEWHGYSHAEIAEMLGISAGASGMRLARARKLLRDILVEEQADACR